MKKLDELVMTLRTRHYNTIDVYIDIHDTGLSRKWLTALNGIINNNLILEKNYCFMGFVNSERNGQLLLDEINNSIEFINSSSLDYHIETDPFTLENCLHYGEVGFGHPGLRINHDRFNWLHRWFEELQGIDTGDPATSMTDNYRNATQEEKYHMRQLNLLCHEFETWALSNRKLVQAPEWMQKSQLMCWLNAPRFDLVDEADFEGFGIDALTKDFGGVYVGVNKAVGKTHWEVFVDEGGALDTSGGNTMTLGEITIACRSQTKAAGDFDISWSKKSDFPQHIELIDKFVSWLRENELDPQDPTLTLGHPQVGQVDLARSFNTDIPHLIWYLMNDYLDVYKIRTSDASVTYDYFWHDEDFKNRLIQETR
jgi:hypothetical protein